MNYWSSLKELPKNIWLISFVALINRAGTMVLPFLALYLTQEIGVEAGSAGLALTFYGIGAFISAPFAGKLSDKIGALNLIKLSLFLSGGMFFTYTLSNDYIAISIISVILAVLSEAFRPAGMAFISNEVSIDQRKQAYALYRLAINLGMSIGPVVGGLLSSVNFNLIFYVDGITSIAAGIFLVLVKWQTKSDPKEKTDKNKEVTVNISQKDYKEYKYELSFEQVCKSFSELFLGYLNNFKNKEYNKILQSIKSVNPEVKNTYITAILLFTILLVIISFVIYAYIS